MEKYNLFIKTIIENAERFLDMEMKSSEFNIGYINSLRMHVNFSIQNKANGFLTCLVMNGEINSLEMLNEMNRIMEKFPV